MTEKLKKLRQKWLDAVNSLSYPEESEAAEAYIKELEKHLKRMQSEV
jgi:hypothetical protein